MTVTVDTENNISPFAEKAANVVESLLSKTMAFVNYLEGHGIVKITGTDGDGYTYNCRCGGTGKFDTIHDLIEFSCRRNLPIEINGQWTKINKREIASILNQD